jgi:predicted ATP-dependent endonuclease of OLD family
MRLKEFRVANYRAILDSSWIDVSDITVVVGKNESGKTGLLRALHKFKPFKAEPYVIEREWPRGHRKERSPDAVVVEARFGFDATELTELAKLGDQASNVHTVQIAKTYKGAFTFTFLPTDIPDSPSASDLEGSFATDAANWAASASPQLDEALTTIAADVGESLRTSGVAATAGRVAAWSQAIDQAVQADQASDQKVATRAKKTLAALAEKCKASPKTQAVKLVEAWLPTFIYMDDHKPFSGVAHLDQVKSRKDSNSLTEEDKTFLTILEMAGLEFETEYRRATETDKEQRMLDMSDASLTLTKMIADHWSQRRYEVRFEADGHHVIAFVSDQVQPALVPLNERSKGFQWFFSFDMTFLHETKGTFRNAILLLDEPGLHLHAAAQRDLLKRMKEYARGNQLIYTTHMPFMIDMERLDNIRVCTETKDKGTKVSADFYAADEHARFPLQAALGLSMSQSLFVGPFNLVVEGVTDFWFLSAISAMLRDAGKPALDERIVVTPSGGASKAAYVGTMLQGQQLNVVVLLDSDPEGRKVAEGLIKQWIMKDRHVLRLGDAVGRSTDSTVEDLFPLEFYLGFVNQAYSKELVSNPVTVKDINADSASLVVDRINNVLKARGLPVNSDGFAFNKGRAAKLILQSLAGKTVGDFPNDTFSQFEKLFGAVNAAMPQLASPATAEAAK